MPKVISKEEIPKNALGVIVGRFACLHLGHQRLIQTAIEETDGNVLVVVGSANVLDERTPFSIVDRVDWIKKVFPNVSVDVLNDYDDNMIWEVCFGQIMRDHLHYDSQYVVFYTGSLDDVKWLSEDAMVRVVDRSGLLLRDHREDDDIEISGTLARQYLQEGDSLDCIVPREIAEDVQRAWKEYISNR